MFHMKCNIVASGDDQYRYTIFQWSQPDHINLKAHDLVKSDDIFQLRLMPTERESDQAYLLGQPLTQNPFKLAVSRSGVSLSTKRISLALCLLVGTNMVECRSIKICTVLKDIVHKTNKILRKDFIYACDPYDYFMYNNFELEVPCYSFPKSCFGFSRQPGTCRRLP